MLGTRHSERVRRPGGEENHRALVSSGRRAPKTIVASALGRSATTPGRGARPSNYLDQVRRLTEAEFKSTMRPMARRIGLDERPPFDFWTYFDAIPNGDWAGHDFSAGTVSFAYEMTGTDWEHVLVESTDRNVNTVLVLDLERQRCSATTCWT